MQRQILNFLMLMLCGALCAHASNHIVGEAKVLPEDMCEFVRQHNPDFPLEIAEAYYEIGSRYGIRGDVALCQAIIETGWFKFRDGTAVTPDQYNFCGLGVTKLGVKGNAFNSIQEGVTAQIQHLYAYATRSSLPDGEELVDARFTLVNRGCAPTWEGLGGRWAARKSYGKDILNLYSKMSSRYAGEKKKKSEKRNIPVQPIQEIKPMQDVQPVRNIETVQPVMSPDDEHMMAAASERMTFDGDSRMQVLSGLDSPAVTTSVVEDMIVPFEDSSVEVVRQAFANVSADEADASHCQPVFPAVPARLIPYFMDKATIHAPAE